MQQTSNDITTEVNNYSQILTDINNNSKKRIGVWSE